jgi:CubicO group peptidase (beta-lactamase class C family)
MKSAMKLLSALLTSLCFVSYAQIPDDIKHEVDLRVQHELNPSIVLGVYENGQLDFYTQGLQNKEKSIDASIDSVYEIGSVSKTFTALLLAQAVTMQKINLDDAVENTWSESFSLKDSDGQDITFKHLSTHTSGLPRMPNNINLFVSDPYANYTVDMLIAAVEAVKPSKAGVNYDYSNFAVGLLGETLARVNGKSFNELLTENIISPLNLSHTYTQINQVPANLLVQGYAGNSAAIAWNFQALAGAGSIRSSIKDLLTYGIAYLNPPSESMKKAMNLTLQTHYEKGDLTVGLGWHHNGGIWWHNGGTAGFRSIIMLDPVNQKVAAGITNHDKNDVEDLVAHLLDPTKPLRNHDFPVSIATDQLSQFTGQFYSTESNKTITIIQQNKQLFFTADKQPKHALTFIGNDRFKFNMIKVKIEFQKDQSDQVTSLSLMGWGKPQSYKKSIEG